jgi:23S rRNA (cytosine1962-C5)-methyltransferase
MLYEKIILKSGRERSLINRHPWVFSGGVKQMPKSTNGSIVEVRTNADELLGYGFFAPNSQIMCRLFEFTSEPQIIDEQYWENKIIKAFEYRKQFIDSNTTNIYRLIHAEGDFFPGIIIDIYKQVAVCQILIKGVELISEWVFKALKKLGFTHIYLKT